MSQYLVDPEPQLMEVHHPIPELKTIVCCQRLPAKLVMEVLIDSIQKIACRLQTPGPLLLKSLFSPATFALIKTLALLHFESFTTFQLFNW